MSSRRPSSNKPRGRRGRRGGGGGGGGRGRARGRGGGGGGGGRKGAYHDWDDEFDFCLDTSARPSRPSSSRGKESGGRGRGARGGGTWCGTGRGLPRARQSQRSGYTPGSGGRSDSAWKADMPLQKIHMTLANQTQVTELLQDLQIQESEEDRYSGSDSEEEAQGAEEEYDELDYREEGQFWVTGEEPVEFAGSTAREWASEDEEKPGPAEPSVSLFAVGRLSRYGFDRQRSRQALESGVGEVGATLEQLLRQVFGERYGPRASPAEEGPQAMPLAECQARRREEALVLSAIYGDRFTERIADSVWTVSLDLQGWFEAPNARKQSRVQPEEVCKFYLKGAGCRFGDKCRFGHQLAGGVRDSSAGGGPSQPGFSSCSPPEYELEVRFPKGSRYPFQPALVAFSTSDERVTPAGRLCVSEMLFGEALTAAQAGEPVVHTLIACFEDESRMKELLSAAHHKYSSPPPVLAPPTALAPAKTKCSGISGTTWKKQAANSDDDSSPSSHGAKVKETAELEDATPAPTGGESYVRLEKKTALKRETMTKEQLRENGTLCREFHRKQSSQQFVAMLRERQKLPAWQERENILERLQEGQALVVSGMTGCGKTTQIPQFILDGSLAGPADRVANIVCTQPRRLSAVSVAQRVAQERAERPGRTVGYQIRLEAVRSSTTRLLYCTTGILLQRLVGEADLPGITHVIVDEVHERTAESDFLLLILKDLMSLRPDLKVILMSATLDAQLFSKYFDNCSTLHVPGRTFPVDQFFLEDAIAKTKYKLEEGSPYQRSGKPPPGRTDGYGGMRMGRREEEEDTDTWSFASFQKNSTKDSIPDEELALKDLCVRYKDFEKSVLKTIYGMDLEKINMDLVESLLEWIVFGDHGYPPGAVLVFMPGMAEIKTLYEQLRTSAVFSGRNGKRKRCLVLPLHSSLTTEEQQAVFQRPPEGITKIIISTNIAETSITIDDVVYVVDSGKMKEKRYDSAKCMEILEDAWVSRASALQRRGRAGRVASGVCFHLFTSHRYARVLAERQLPEILRVPLEQLCLRIKILDLFAERSLESVFSQLIEPPASACVDAARQRLQDLGALAAVDETLTPLGYHLASLPVDVRIGKLILLGAIFRCLDPALTIAASLAFKSPFISPWEKRKEAEIRKQSFALANSDHLAVLQAYKGWRAAAKNGNGAGYRYCRENFLSAQGLQDIASLKRLFAELLSDIGFVKGGLKAQVIERMSSSGSDGVLEATGFEANLNSENTKLMSAMLCAALYPNVVQVRAPTKSTAGGGSGVTPPRAEELRFLTKSDGCVHVHPSSINFPVRHYETPYLVYHEKVKTSRVFIRDTSMVSPYPLVLFGGGQVHVELQRGVFVVSLDDGWIRFAAESHKVAELLKELRGELDRLLADKIREPGMDLCTCPQGSRIIATIVKLISTE